MPSPTKDVPWIEVAAVLECRMALDYLAIAAPVLIQAIKHVSYYMNANTFSLPNRIIFDKHICKQAVLAIE